MQRAKALFERAGMTVIPFPVDFKVAAGRSITVLDFLPTAGAMAQTEMAMREGYGLLYYFVIR